MRPRSLRLRAFAVVMLVVLAPLCFVWISNFADVSTGWQMQRRVERIADRAARHLEEGVPVSQLEEASSWRQVRLRVVAADGEVVADIDNEALPELLSWAGAIFFGPDGAPSLAEWDARQPPLSQRAELVKARAEGMTSGCISADMLSKLDQLTQPNSERYQPSLPAPMWAGTRVGWLISPATGI